VGCFSFERVEVLIFRVFGRCSKPTVWDGDVCLDHMRIEYFFCSKPTVWDVDRVHLSGKARKYSVSFVFQAHCVGW